MTRNVYIVIFKDVVLSSAAAPLDMFLRTNAMLEEAGELSAFNVELIGEQADTVPLIAPAAFLCGHGLEDRLPGSREHHRSLIFVPAFLGEWDAVREQNRKVIQWIADHYRGGTEVASLCRGSYFLAEAGLLDGMPCTSHWGAIQHMRERYPNIDLQPDAVVTDKNGIYTGGGAFSSLNLVLYLVEKFCGHEIGIQVARNFSIQRDNVNQAHFSIFGGLHDHGDRLIGDAQAFIEANYTNEVSIDDVADHVHMSKRNFIRRFKRAVRLTPLEYMQRVKIEAAKKALENDERSIQALPFKVGYNDTKTFRDTFKRFTGLTPLQYRRKYARRASF